MSDKNQQQVDSGSETESTPLNKQTKSSTVTEKLEAYRDKISSAIYPVLFWISNFSRIYPFIWGLTTSVYVIQHNKDCDTRLLAFILIISTTVVNHCFIHLSWYHTDRFLYRTVWESIRLLMAIGIFLWGFSQYNLVSSSTCGSNIQFLALQTLLLMLVGLIIWIIMIILTAVIYSKSKITTSISDEFKNISIFDPIFRSIVFVSSLAFLGVIVYQTSGNDPREIWTAGLMIVTMMFDLGLTDVIRIPKKFPASGEYERVSMLIYDWLYVLWYFGIWLYAVVALATNSDFAKDDNVGKTGIAIIVFSTLYFIILVYIVGSNTSFNCTKARRQKFNDIEDDVFDLIKNISSAEKYSESDLMNFVAKKY
jgi:hypothetical protein